MHRKTAECLIRTVPMTKSAVGRDELSGWITMDQLAKKLSALLYSITPTISGTPQHGTFEIMAYSQQIAGCFGMTITVAYCHSYW